ncbi:neuronal acetylcholine receptor subunit alpha-3-like isoform X2 [Clytia hemisphaerica]|uniref:Uncharacterized protein n=1 Tax=Clytia hemisphaerica TaxID=252671 RepID=A0A7M5UEX7_9CNID
MLVFYMMVLCAAMSTNRHFFAHSYDNNPYPGFNLAYESLDEGEQRLLKYLKNFSVNSRPVNISSTAVYVNVTMEIVRLDAVSEKGQSVRMKLHINYLWRNPYLVWNPLNYKGVSEVILPEGEIWIPPIRLFNEASKTQGEYNEDNHARTVLLTNDGNCSLTYAQFFKSTCEIDVSDFPFDQQYCDMTFGSWSMDERLLQLRAVKEEAISEQLYKENGEWHLTEATLKTHDVRYPIHRHKHSTIKLSILIKRKYIFFIMNLVVPCALIACMIFLVFVLPAKSGERISLGITVMLSMAIFQELSSEKLPSSSDNYPLLGVYYTTSMFEIGIALVMNCFILNVYYRNYEMQPWMRRLLFDKLARLVRIDIPHTRTQHYIDRMSTGQFRELNPLAETTLNNTAHNAHNIDGESALGNGNGEMSYFPKSTLHREDTQTIQRKTKKFSVNQNGSSSDLTYTKSNLSAKISLSLSSDPSTRIEERKLLGEDWKTAARILDRCMLAIAISVGVISALTIFMQAARFREMFIP